MGVYCPDELTTTYDVAMTGQAGDSWEENHGRYEQLLRYVLGDLGYNQDRVGNLWRDDCLQEARVALWREHHRHGGPLPDGLVRVVARRAVIDALRVTTTVARPGRPRNTARSAHSLDAYLETVGDSWGGIAAPDNTAHVAEADELWSAVNSLRGRRRVVALGRMNGFTSEEIRDLTGAPSAGAVSVMWGSVRRDHLIPALTGKAPPVKGPVPARNVTARVAAREIRVWARTVGWSLNPRGRIPVQVVDAYYRAHPDVVRPRKGTRR